MGDRMMMWGGFGWIDLEEEDDGEAVLVVDDPPPEGKKKPTSKPKPRRARKG